MKLRKGRSSYATPPMDEVQSILLDYPTTWVRIQMVSIVDLVDAAEHDRLNGKPIIGKPRIAAYTQRDKKGKITFHPAPDKAVTARIRYYEIKEI